MSGFKKITDDLYVSAQITAADIAEAKAQGITAIVNNRPDGEEPDQPDGSTLARHAQDAGLSYTAIPVTHAGFGHGQIDAMAKVIDNAGGPVLAFCRSGTRSALLWALTAAQQGQSPAAIAAKAAAAGYDITPIRPMVDMLSAGRD
ncbi:TIGR01244 family sulfur transferase [Croceicoccus sp. F390]|uniref:TIGR01244 family sulfur transferase n=1 Tax=Croceicoccus esteveae TaxID=3075597 RepID=A0ABU2ZJH8_9SPHN|nr:TIGR01244 family sulfur transferase [Croceicoccus sp. F390]MDT0576761.1 TIGR01244 family sulfur transferase [Croceicoccus sp. F390]